MLCFVLADTSAHSPTSKPRPHSGGSTFCQKLRDSAAQSRAARGVGAAAVFKCFWLAALAGCALIAAFFIASCDGAGVGSSGEWKTALTMVISGRWGGVWLSLLGLDLEAVGILGGVFAVPHHAVDQLARAQHILGHIDLHGAGDRLVQVHLVHLLGHGQIVGVALE